MLKLIKGKPLQRFTSSETQYTFLGSIRHWPVDIVWFIDVLVCFPLLILFTVKGLEHSILFIAFLQRLYQQRKGWEYLPVNVLAC